MATATMPGTIMILSVNHHGSGAPDRPTGIALGVGAWQARTPVPGSSGAFPAC
jgi:hypothetical protein